MKADNSRRASLCLLLIFLFPIAAYPAPRLELGLRLSGSLSLLNPKDINKALFGWRDFRRKVDEAIPKRTFESGKVKGIHTGFGLEGEILLSLGNRWAVGIGSGTSNNEVMESDTALVFSQNSVSMVYARPTKITAVPLIISGYRFLALGRKLFLYVRAGAGWVWARYTDREAFKKKASDEKFTYPFLQSASGWGSLLQGGLGLEYTQDQSLGFFCEALLRRSRIKTMEDRSQPGQTGTLYSFEEYDPKLDFWETQIRVISFYPSGENFRSVRKTVVDLSGFILRLGVSIKF